MKWAVLAVTLGIYYLLPFLRWDRGPNAPDQAVLVDLAEPPLLFLLHRDLAAGSLLRHRPADHGRRSALFLMNAVAGRVWCGYLCPQTVWTDLFLAVERLVEGDRREHISATRQPWTLEQARRKRGVKHVVWLLIAWWTGGAWVLYFADAPTLVRDLATVAGAARRLCLDRHPDLHDLSLAGFMREQVCTYMCPWPRIQAALTDEHALNVTYRY